MVLGLAAAIAVADGDGGEFAFQEGEDVVVGDTPAGAADFIGREFAVADVFEDRLAGLDAQVGLNLGQTHEGVGLVGHDWIKTGISEWRSFYPAIPMSQPFFP